MKKNEGYLVRLFKCQKRYFWNIWMFFRNEEEKEGGGESSSINNRLSVIFLLKLLFELYYVRVRTCTVCVKNWS